MAQYISKIKAFASEVREDPIFFSFALFGPTTTTLVTYALLRAYVG